MNENHALALLHKMIGEDKTFRPGQWEAIEAVAIKKQRALVVQRTGWGKSLVYFIATKLLREQNAGLTLLISPLLSLMRNQAEMATKIGLRAFSINSANRTEWGEVENALLKDECDIMLISPERLNNDHFLKKVLPSIPGQIGLFVVDEAHCISDWGHDFRPDYRRIIRILQLLPKNVPVLATTATANDRVVSDVQLQLGPDLHVYRGPLARESLRLQNLNLSKKSERLAWLADNLNKFKGSGIVYCSTVADVEQVAKWLRSKGYLAEAYHAGKDGEMDRIALEQAFINNEIKILVATVALGMGFDKPDIEFVVHFQKPGSVVAYYQQVGRAGRALNKSYGILLNGIEDDNIQNYFIDTAFPSEDVFLDILRALEKSEGLSMAELMSDVNTSTAMAEKALKILELEGAVQQTNEEKRIFFRTVNQWEVDREQISRIQALRREELAQMQDYVTHTGCLMQFLLAALDDHDAKPCGRCANCQGKGFTTELDPDLLREAEQFLKSTEIPITPRKRFPEGLLLDQKNTIPPKWQNADGRSLSFYGHAGWGEMVQTGKYVDDYFADDLVDASVQLIKNIWAPDPFPNWICSIPSLARPELVSGFARRLAKELGIPYLPVLERVRKTEEQKMMQNSFMQAKNVLDTLYINSPIPSGSVLLIDDIIDSGWTLTMAGYLLRKNGSGLVYPFTLAKASKRSL